MRVIKLCVLSLNWIFHHKKTHESISSSPHLCLSIVWSPWSISVSLYLLDRIFIFFEALQKYLNIECFMNYYRKWGRFPITQKQTLNVLKKMSYVFFLHAKNLLNLLSFHLILDVDIFILPIFPIISHNKIHLFCNILNHNKKWAR